MKLILVRHGQSQWNLENRFTGWENPDITEKGIQEAKDAGELLKNEKIDVFYTSALKRAQHTLDIILDTMDIQNVVITRNQALNERDYGDLTGLNKKELTEKVGTEQVHIWRRSYDVQPPGGESLKDTCDRVIPYYESEIVPKLKAGKSVLIVAHGNSLRALVMHVEGLSPEEILKREIGTGQPIVYEFNKELEII